jgi:hypothetical protein
MSDPIDCPNCGATMNAGGHCPQCEHDDQDARCECIHCIHQRVKETEDEFND